MYTNGTTTISGKKIVVDGCVILNPTKEQLQEAGWTEVVPPTPTAEEIAQQQREAEVWSLKEQLRESDYKAIKFAEGWITAEDYAETKAQRQAWRERINELEELNS
jgi:methylmalonyl-CoA mutase cobalamin-binding subunit